MKLTKHHGLANDFLVLLDEVNGAAQVLDGSLVERLCSRRTGVGADGIVHGSAPGDGDEADVVMRLFNADGTVAEMSGNGIRCLGQAIAMARGHSEMVLRVATDAGVRTVEVLPGPTEHQARVRVAMGQAGAGPAVPAPLADRMEGRFDTVDMGNPHLVLLVDDPAQVDLESEGAWLERQFPLGVNVEFVAARGGDTVEMRVWERGVGPTRACGTGACAAAYAMRSWGLVGDRVRVEMSGGAAHVDLTGDEVVLEGPAQFVATVEVPV